MAGGYGSSPVFADVTAQEKFWRRQATNWMTPKPTSTGLRACRRRRLIRLPIAIGRGSRRVSWMAVILILWRGNARHPGIFDEDHPKVTGGYGSTIRVWFSSSSLSYRIRLYYASTPRLYSQEHQSMWHLIRRFREDFLLGADDKQLLRRTLIATLHLNRLANRYAKFWAVSRRRDREVNAGHNVKGVHGPRVWRDITHHC